MKADIDGLILAAGRSSRMHSNKVEAVLAGKPLKRPLSSQAPLKPMRRKAVFFLLIASLWLTNVMLSDEDTEQAIETLLAVLAEAPGTIVMVSNEVGLGIVPENALARRFRDEAGRVHQKLAACCDEVVFVAAGLPLHLKGKG